MADALINGRVLTPRGLEPATVLLAGPALAAVATVLLAAAGVALVLRGHRMPRLGRRYRTPTARPNGQAIPDGQFWERMDVGEDPTAPGHPR